MNHGVTGVTGLRITALTTCRQDGLGLLLPRRPMVHPEKSLYEFKRTCIKKRFEPNHWQLFKPKCNVVVKREYCEWASTHCQCRSCCSQHADTSAPIALL
ncbi:hypothetical protein EI94DRAFT_1734265 [Lactarius quietus]|nr:hypothetical protein EI94DRAFT_1734265 [Lactarius quietus]